MHLLRFVCWLVASLMIISFAPSAIAQETQDYETGLNPYQSYQSGNIDSINLFNRSLNVDIPLISYPQRGGKLHLDFDLHYMNQGNWYNCTPGTNCSSFYGTGLTNGFGVILKNWPSTWGTTCQALGDQYGTWTCQGSATMSDGSSHSMLPITLNSWESQDTSGLQMDGTEVQAGNSPPLLIDANGTRYNQTYTPSWFPTVVGGYTYQTYIPTSVEDVNGNEISYSQTAGWNDTMGRQVLLPASASTNLCPQSPLVPVSAYTWNLPGVNAGTYPLTFCYVNVAVTQHWDNQIQHISLQELQTVLLPNGTSWTFQYTTDGNGDLSQITFPTGGTLSYTWTTESPVCGAHYYDNARAVVTRTLNPNDGVSPPGTWTYSGLSNVIPVVTDPASNDIVHTYSTLTPNTCPYFETKTQYYQGSHTSGTLLKTVSTTYQPVSSSFYLQGIAQPSQTETLWANNQEDETTYAYDSALTFHNPYWVSNTQWSPYMDGTATGSYGLLETQKDHDYGSGAPSSTVLRTTSTTYEALSNSNYLNNNLLNIPATVTVTGAGPGSTTTYAYDQTTPVSSGITYQHSTSPPAGTYRGNLTKISRYLNTTGTYLNTTQTNWDTGMPDVVTDTKGNPTTYGYSLSYVGAYLTSVKNALNQTTAFTYDVNMGYLASTTDPNSQQTTYAYNDKLGGLTAINYPDGGQTSYSYNDSTPAPTVTTTKLATPDPTITSVTTYDGLGRLSETELTSDLSGTDHTIITYDANGRIASETNPYRTTSDSTYGITSYQYDALNRTTLVTNPDSSTAQTTYTGRATEVTDEGNGTKRLQRISQTDGLGRLMSVCEVSSTALTVGASPTPTACGQDISGTGFLTTYQYDALNDLTGVSQPGLNPRSFTYDSLSRITSASNPESGSTCYGTVSAGACQNNGYDANGNVITKTDARGITTTYSYDVLNRLTQKSYSDGTPTANFFYDANVWHNINLTNTVGRLSYDGALSGSTYVASEAFSYDSMGRVINNSQCTVPGCPNGPYSVTYGYDLIGDMTSTSPGAPVTLTYGYNSAAQLTSVTSSLVDANHPSSLLSSVLYNPAGSLSSASMGTISSTSGISESRTYDKRLRTGVISTGVNTPTGFVGLVGMTYGYAPNGNVTSLADGPTGNWTFTYDDFNRLQSTVVPNYPSSPYAYVYDRYGNRWKQTANGTCTAGTAFCISFDANNHVTGGILTYDAAGNVIADNMHHYTYDAENRLTQVDAGTTASYVYDASGRRMQKTTAGTTVNYIYDLNGHDVTEYSSTGEWNRGEIYAGSRHLVTYRNSLTYFSSVDALGSERVRSTQNESSYESCDSLPFGDDQYCFGSAVGNVSPLHFTGQERDTETNLDNFKARYMESTLGRFMSPDPANAGANSTNPQSWNMYSYALNSPLVFTDPTGLGPCEEDNDDPTCAPGTGNGYGYSYYPQPDFDIEAPPQQNSTPSLTETSADLGDPTNVKVVTNLHLDFCPTSDLGCAQELRRILNGLQWGKAFAKSFFTQTYRRPDESFAACVNRDIKDTSFGTLDPSKVLSPTAIKAEFTALVGIAIAVPSPNPTGGTAFATTVITAASRGIGYLGASPAVATRIAAAANGAGTTLAVAGAATAGATIGAAANCTQW
jgi:RHS repeat-associated protein